jgi:uroporphyrinogen-III synthase
MSEQAVLPLQGKRILVTRTREQASVLSARLRAQGAEPLEFPTIRIVPPADWSELDAALQKLPRTDGSGYTWMILTSANGAHICMRRLRDLGISPASFPHVRIATIGPATAAALEEYGRTADLIPDAYVAEGIMQSLHEDAEQRQQPLAGQRFLLARAAEARKVLVEELQAAGAFVDEIPAYTTVSVAQDDARGHEVLRLLQEQKLAILSFTSSSTVRNFVSWLKSCAQGGDEQALLDLVSQHTQLACIGPITSQTARELGLPVAIEATEFTIDGLVNAIVKHEGNYGRSDNHANN